MTFTVPPANKVANQGGFVADIDNAYAALQQLAAGNVLNTAYAGGADPSGLSDSTAAVQAAEDALAAAGGGTLVFPAGTYKVTGLVKKSGVSWVTDGRGAVVLQLAAGVNAPLLVSDGFASLTMSGSNSAGITGFAVRDIVFDGNASGQSAAAAAGVQIFGFDFLLDNVSVRNFLAADGLYTEWGAGGQPGPEGGMEACYRFLRIHGNTLTGAAWRNRGPHDSLVFGALVYQNGTSAAGYWAESSLGTYTATGLSGTAVSSTPATITLNTTLGLPSAGSVTVPSAGGTVTVAYTGTTATTLTGCTAAGGSGNYTSNTVTPPSYTGAAALVHGMHVWGSHSVGYVLDAETHLVNCQAEGASTGQVLVRAGNSTWDGGKIFSPASGAYGLQLGDTANKSTAFCLNGPLITGFAGTSAATAAVNAVNTASGQYRATVFQGSGQALWGTFQPYELRRFSFGGLVTPSAAAAAGAGTSPPAPTLSNASDNRGSVNWGTGTSPAAGPQVTVTFAQPKPGTPTVTLTPANSATAALQPYLASVSSTAFTVGLATAPAASQAAGTYSVAYADGTG